ncbi:MAG: hypothetical protein CMJ70_13580 [Planctomycetaceae bacterium]|nr:hypothetical protein [Planctomycetaceae bacterium]HAA67590.1 hypothetical protein [Planctomycetaceae bacterium]
MTRSRRCWREHERGAQHPIKRLSPALRVMEACLAAPVRLEQELVSGFPVLLILRFATAVKLTV